MLIDNIEMQCQKDPQSRDLVMTHPVWQNDDPDLIQEYGCKVVAFCNAYNLYNKDIHYFSIEELNNLIKENNGYLYLRSMEQASDIESVKKLCLNRESELLDDVLFPILNIKSCIRNYKGEIDISSKKDYFICKTRYKSTGHFSLIIGSDYRYLDSYNCNIVFPSKSDILEVRKVTFF